MARIIVGLSALTWAGFGIMLFADPGNLDGVGLAPDGPIGRQEVRAFYGGLELGIAIFLVWSMLHPQRMRAGLVLALSAIGATGAGRLAGVALEGFETVPLMWTFIVLELTAAVVTGWALARLPAST